LESDRPKWLNGTVLGAGLTSFFADLSYEAALGALPAYLTRFGVSPAIIGVIEGAADAVASFVKLGSGWWSDAVARRKPFAVAGYVLTGLMPVALAVSVAWPLVALARLAGWFGKGLRGPARDALLAAAVPREDRGKAFGLHRAADTCGAVLGPLLAAEILRRAAPTWDVPERAVLWWSALPGLLAVLSMLLLVREVRGAAVKRYAFRHAMGILPAGLKRYLVSVGLFGLGDCSAALTNIAVIIAFSPVVGATEAAVFALRLVAFGRLVAALASFPIGWCSDRLGRAPLLVTGYFLGTIEYAGFAAAMWVGTTNPVVWFGLFGLVGVVIAAQETLESAATVDFVADPALHGTALGLLGAVNGMGDFLASAAVGLLITIAPTAGFAYAASFAAAGTVVLAMTARGLHDRG
jgi:MFS family permease